MDHAHHHGSSGATHLPALRIAFVLTSAFLVVEVVVAWATRSLAVASDAGHMATDVAGLGMAWAAVAVATRARHASSGRTYGLYRLEILAAALNAGLMLVVAGYVLVESFRRLSEPTDVPGAPLLVVALLGLVVNVACFRLLSGGAGHSLNVRGAYLEVVADLVGSVGVLLAAVLILSTGWTWVDPVVGAAVGAFIVPRAVLLGASALRILLQMAPAHVDMSRVETDLGALESVVDVHDLHVWTLTSEMEVASVHLIVAEDADLHSVLHAARDVLEQQHGIAHATLQIEPPSHRDCAEVGW